MPRHVRQSEPFAGRVVSTDDVSRVERRPDRGRKDEAPVVLPSSDAEPFLELTPSLLA